MIEIKLAKESGVMTTRSTNQGLTTLETYGDGTTVELIRERSSYKLNINRPCSITSYGPDIQIIVQN